MTRSRLFTPQIRFFRLDFVVYPQTRAIMELPLSAAIPFSGGDGSGAVRSFLPIPFALLPRSLKTFGAPRLDWLRQIKLRMRQWGNCSGGAPSCRLPDLLGKQHYRLATSRRWQVRHTWGGNSVAEARTQYGRRGCKSYPPQLTLTPQGHDRPMDKWGAGREVNSVMA